MAWKKGELPQEFKDLFPISKQGSVERAVAEAVLMPFLLEAGRKGDVISCNTHGTMIWLGSLSQHFHKGRVLSAHFRQWTFVDPFHLKQYKDYYAWRKQQTPKRLADMPIVKFIIEQPSPAEFLKKINGVFPNFQ